MNRKMIGSANGAKTARTGATPSSTASVGPTSAVTGSGSASVIQSVIMHARIAASRCAGAGRPGIGQSSSATKISGATTSPIVRRRRLNCSSAGE